MPGNFNRSFHSCSGSGSIIANVDGPIRAIRTAYGFNSARHTKLHYFFYDRMEAYIVDRRPTHLSPGGGIVLDVHNENAIGMRYRNSSNPEGVLMDGVEDEINDGPCYWELLSGEQGSFCKLTYKISNVAEKQRGPHMMTGYYRDSRNPQVTRILGGGVIQGKPDNAMVMGPEVMIGVSGILGHGEIRSVARDRGEVTLSHQKYVHGLDAPTPDVAKRILWEEIAPLKIECKRVVQ